MALPPATRPKPGLKAIYEGREQRKPGGKYGRPSTALYLFGVSAIIGSLFVYHYVSEYQLDSEKRELLAEQRAMKTTIGAEWFPLRERSSRSSSMRGRPTKATSSTARRRAGTFALRQGSICACASRTRRTPRVCAGPRSSHSATASSDASSASRTMRGGGRAGRRRVPEQPWNLGRAYNATRVLTDEWADDVKAADDKMQVAWSRSSTRRRAPWTCARRPRS